MAATALMERARGLHRSPEVERGYPFVLALVAGLAAWAFDPSLPEPPNFLLSATVTVGSITSGFVGTSLSILIALKAPVMRDLHKSSYILVLRNYLGWALVGGVILACTGLVGMLSWLSPDWLAVAWFAAVALCLGCLWRLGRIMLLLLGHPDTLDDAPTS